MEDPKTYGASTIQEINLQTLIKKIWKRKFQLMASLFFCVGLAVLYVKWATPVYEAKTSVLIDQYGKSRMLGESQYVQGGVGLIETEKNLYNEMGVIKSYGLVKQTLEDLDLDVSYYSGPWYQRVEHYGYFPFAVEVVDTSAQLFNLFFQVELLSEETYRLSVQADEFVVSNPSTGARREVKSELDFSGNYAFGQEVKHDYFHFVLKKPDYQVVMDEFADKELYFKTHSYDQLANAYLSKLKVLQTDIQASILELSIRGPVLDKSIDFLNRLSENYILTKLAERDDIASSKEAFIRQQLAGISDSLARAEIRLEAFRRSNRAVNLTQTATNALDQIQELQTEQAQIELNLQYYSSLLEYLKDTAGIDKIMAPSVVGINDPLLNENLLELKRLYTEKTRLDYFKGAKSYDIEIINQQIRGTTASLRESVRNLIQSTQLAHTDLNERIINLQQVIDRLPTNEKQLGNFQRKSTMYENLYNYLSQELAKTGIARAEDIADTKILDEARMVGNGPVAPQKMLILAFAVILGLMFPVGWIAFFDTQEELIEDLHMLEQHTKLPVVASIAHDGTKPGSLKEDPYQWQVDESFRDLGANLQFLVPNPEKNVIGVISTIPGEGKTFCSVKLGINLAKGGKKILLVDTDFRKPGFMESRSSSKGRPGFADYLHGEVSAEDIIEQHDEIPELHYIPIHHVEENSHELLTSPRIEELLQEYRDAYDYIIFDAPALGLVSDYLLISRLIDIHLFVVRRKLSRLAFLSDLEKLKKRGNLEPVFLVFNDVRRKSFKYGYSYYENGKARRRKYSVGKTML